MDILKSHRTIRKYNSRDVSDEVLTEILECGISASNTGNMQLYSVIVTREALQKEKLAPFHFNQPMVMNAPAILTVCFDFNRFLHWCRVNKTFTDFRSILWLLIGFIDSSILAQNICVAAESFGLGICYLGTTLYNIEEISQILGLPKGVVPVTTITLGYPEIVPEKVDRLPLNAVVHHERYADYSSDSINEMYSFKENLETSRQFVEQNSKENLAQVYAEVRYKTEDSLLFSGKLIQFLEGQGFRFNAE